MIMKIFEALRPTSGPTTAEIMTSEISTKEILAANRLAKDLPEYFAAHRQEVDSPRLTVITAHPEVTTKWDKVTGRAFCTFEITIDLGLKKLYQPSNDTDHSLGAGDSGQVSHDLFSISDIRELQQVISLVNQSFQTEYWQPLHPATVETHQLWSPDQKSSEPQAIPVEHRFHFDFVPQHEQLPRKGLFQKVLQHLAPTRVL